MYRLRVVSGEESGPYTLDQIRALLLEGRVSLQAFVRREGDEAWQPLDTLQDLAGLNSLPATSTSSSSPLSPAPSVATPPPLFKKPSPLPPARTSRLAIASVGVGFFGFLIFPAVVGLCLGIAGLVTVRRSQGKIKGRGLALFGILLSLFTALTAVLAVVFIVHNQQHWQGHPTPATPLVTCAQNLPKLGAAIRQYANDHGDILPAATNWCDSVRDFVPSLGVFTCPGAPASANSIFAMNMKVASMNLDSVDPNTVLLFEVDGGWNLAGGAEMATTRGVSPGLVHVYTARGQVRQIPVRQIMNQRWEP